MQARASCSCYVILSDTGFTAGTLWLSPQINTAKRILEKGKEEPERSWFQTKEEKKKEKGMSGRVFRKLNIEFIGPSNPSPRSIPRSTENGDSDGYLLTSIH